MRINVAVRRASVLVSMLLDGDIEFLVCARSQMPQSANVTFRSFGFHSAVFLVRPGHPLLNDATLDIAHFPVIAAGPIGGKSDELYRGFIETYRYQPLMTIESVEALARFTQVSDAIWLSSTFTAATEILEKSLIALEPSHIANRDPIEVGLFTLRHKIASPLVQDIAHRLKAIFDKNLVRQ